ncbi:Uncharacterized protein FKW44_018130 [Caligus rogercresseyi]|uniref:Uncharacterized protein n=1 Tax=Caligus rogercresseyi TaxID=217165 RepID=A0A7T8GTY0_CALRO|nr:Uncharacterized protein FKW44_018130 [Caligus rogercresseyi]
MPSWSSHGEVSMTASVPTSPLDDPESDLHLSSSLVKANKLSGSSLIRSRTFEEPDPYSWLSSTAPTSPDRSRKNSVSKDRKSSFLENISHRFSIGSSSMSQVLQSSQMTLEKLTKRSKEEEKGSRSSSSSRRDGEGGGSLKSYASDGSSSPEQLTVRPSNNTRGGPHVQDVFGKAEESGSGPSAVDGDHEEDSTQEQQVMLTAVLPDGKNLTMPPDPKA